MSLVLSELPYAIDALAEHGMSKETMEYHHDIHHKAYVDNGNNLLKGTEWENKSLEEIIVGNYNANSVAQMVFSTTFLNIGTMSNFGK